MDEAPAELVLPDYRAEDEAEYQQLLVDMDKQFPAAVALPFDFSTLTGNLHSRSAKAVVLHLAAACRWPAEEIAAVIGKPVPLVKRYLTEAIQESLPIDAEDVATVRHLELMKLDAEELWLKREAENSRQEVTETETWEVDDDKGNPIPVAEGTPGARKVVKRVTTKRAGSPAYSRALTAISKRRADTLGLDSPTKVQVDKRVQKMQITVVEVRNREEALAAKAAGLLDAPDK